MRIAGLNRKEWGSTKPTPGTRINWSHPLSYGLTHCYLFNEGRGLPINIAAGKSATSIYSTAGYVGDYFYMPNHWVTQITDPYASPLSAQSHFISFVMNSGGSTYPRLYSRGNSYFRNAGGTLLSYVRDCSGNDKTRDVTCAMAFGTKYTLAISDDGALAYSGTNIYLNGNLCANSYSANGTGSLVDESASTPLIFGGGDGCAGKLWYYYIWNRPISAVEVAQLNYNPYQFFAPVTRRAFYAPAGAPPSVKVPWHLLMSGKGMESA
jgi:hypothetical protein